MTEQIINFRISESPETNSCENCKHLHFFNESAIWDMFIREPDKQLSKIEEFYQTSDGDGYYCMEAANHPKDADIIDEEYISEYTCNFFEES